MFTATVFTLAPLLGPYRVDGYSQLAGSLYIVMRALVAGNEDSRELEIQVSNSGTWVFVS